MSEREGERDVFHQNKMTNLICWCVTNNLSDQKKKKKKKKCSIQKYTSGGFHIKNIGCFLLYNYTVIILIRGHSLVYLFCQLDFRGLVHQLDMTLIVLNGLLNSNQEELLRRSTW